jgi:hypothetical protein
MYISDPSDRDLRYATSAVRRSVPPGTCPRMHWRSVNPALPPPDSPACLTGGPDCCATSAAVDVRRAA